MIKKFAFAVALLAVATSAQAGQINGSQAFGIGVRDKVGLNGATSITLSGVASSVIDAQTGDFIGAPLLGLNSSGSTFTFAVGSAFSFGTAAFGTFTGTVVFDDNTATNSRTSYLQGTFTPGTDSFFTGLTGNTATVVITFNQANGAGNSISGSGTLTTPSFSTPGVPEPATIATALIGVAGLGLARLRRKSA